MIEDNILVTIQMKGAILVLIEASYNKNNSY